ncbi:MAG: amidohydrolase family protein, partial [Chitinophagaceae bacterium]|nr:amidohydrolase family protein [Chitinophagaceae bacterium]
KEGLVDEWKKDLQVFGRYENVYCKIAGLVTEADWKAWQIADFTPYVSTVLDIFGTDRIIFGSDWPVCLPSASYDQVCEIVEKTTSFLSGEEKEKLWGTNAVRFYNL